MLGTKIVRRLPGIARPRQAIVVQWWLKVMFVSVTVMAAAPGHSRTHRNRTPSAHAGQDPTVDHRDQVAIGQCVQQVTCPWAVPNTSSGYVCGPMTQIPTRQRCAPWSGADEVAAAA
jgi:hypothetical protein